MRKYYITLLSVLALAGSSVPVMAQAQSTPAPLAQSSSTDKKPKDAAEIKKSPDKWEKAAAEAAAGKQAGTIKGAKSDAKAAAAQVKQKVLDRDLKSNNANKVKKNDSGTDNTQKKHVAN